MGGQYMSCIICGSDIVITHRFAYAECAACGQGYSFEEEYVVDLNNDQIDALRKHYKETKSTKDKQ